MRVIGVILASVLAVAWCVHDLAIDLPPRPQRIPRLLRCDHCGEREAWNWCAQCGLAFCSECVPVHEPHVGVV